MVYRGKPSKGCDLCRKRKIRCDEEKPQCGQCTKHRTLCPGYRDLDGLNFVDENVHTREAANRKERRRSSDSTNKASLASCTSVLKLGPKRTLSMMQPTSSVEDCALTYFYNNFVAPTYLGFMADREELADASTPLGASIQCAALASFAHRIGSHADILLARKRYARALMLANNALHDARDTKRHDILAAIHFLSVFENFDCDKQDRMTSWQTHVKGNVALIRQMTEDDLVHPHCLPVFNQMRMLVLTACMWSQTPVPRHFIRAIDHAHHHGNYDKPIERLAYKLLKMSIEYINLRCAVRFKELTDPIAILSQSRDLDARLASWYDEAANKDPYWKFERICDTVGSQSEIWDERYDVYSSYPTTMLWFFYRCIRGLLTMMIDFQLRKTYQGSAVEEHLRMAKLRTELLDDICYGVPWRLGYNHEGMTVACGGYGILFPLFYVGEFVLALIRKKTDLCDAQVAAAVTDDDRDAAIAGLGPSRQRRIRQLHWIVGRLEYVAQGLGIFQARVFARLLRTQWQMVLIEQPYLSVEYDIDSRATLSEIYTCARPIERDDVPSQIPSPDREPSPNEALASRIMYFLGDKEKQHSWNEMLLSSKSSTPSLPDSLT